MYTNLTIIVCVLIVIYVFIKYKMFIHPLFIFNIIWLLIFSLESMHFYGLYEAEDRMYMYMFSGIVSFNVGYGIWALFRRKHHLKLFVNNRKKDFEPRYKILYLIAFMCILYYLELAIPSVKLLVTGNSMAEIRRVVQDTGTVDNSIISKVLNAISIIFLIPSASVLQVVGAIDFWIGKKSKKLFVLGVILAIISSIGEGGRTSLVNFLLYMVIGYILSGANLSKISVEGKRKRRRLIIVVSSIAIVFLGWFSISRAGHMFYKNLYLYFSMQPYMFNVWANTVDSTGIWGYSEASLNGFSFAVLYIIKNLLGLNFPAHWEAIYELIRETDSQWQVITSTSTRANAYVTTFWFFYLDGRFWGILIGMFGYGVYVAHTFVEAVKHPNIKTICIFSFMLQGLLWVFIRFSFSNIYYAISYIILVFFVFKRKKNSIA